MVDEPCKSQVRRDMKMSGYGYTGGFALIVVLFILLIIVGAGSAGFGYGY